MVVNPPGGRCRCSQNYHRTNGGHSDASLVERKLTSPTKVRTLAMIVTRREIHKVSYTKNETIRGLTIPHKAQFQQAQEMMRRPVDKVFKPCSR